MISNGSDMKYTFTVPRPRGMIAEASVSPQYVPTPTTNIRDIILHALIARIAYTDDQTEEFLIRLQDDHTLDVTISRERLEQLINEVTVGTKVQDFIDWLTGKRISNLETQIANIPHASTTVYGIVKIGTGIDVADGVISVTTGEGWETVVTSVDYTITHNPIHVICKDSCSITLLASPNLGDRAVIKNATPDKEINVIGTVDGLTDATLTAYEAVNLLFNGVDWSIV